MVINVISKRYRSKIPKYLYAYVLKRLRRDFCLALSPTSVMIVKRYLKRSYVITTSIYNFKSSRSRRRRINCIHKFVNENGIVVVFFSTTSFIELPLFYFRFANGRENTCAKITTSRFLAFFSRHSALSIAIEDTLRRVHSIYYPIRPCHYQRNAI